MHIVQLGVAEVAHAQLLVARLGQVTLVARAGPADHVSALLAVVVSIAHLEKTSHRKGALADRAPVRHLPLLALAGPGFGKSELLLEFLVLLFLFLFGSEQARHSVLLVKGQVVLAVPRFRDEGLSFFLLYVLEVEVHNPGLQVNIGLVEGSLCKLVILPGVVVIVECGQLLQELLVDCFLLRRFLLDVKHQSWLVSWHLQVARSGIHQCRL